MSLVTVDPKSEVSVVSMLEQCRTWLMQAVEATPMEVALVKAQIATAAEATKQLNLSKEIQLDAQEMVRRAEYALGKAIRKGQADGTVATEYEMKRDAALIRDQRLDMQLIKPRPSEYLDGERGHQNGAGVYDLADGVDGDVFEAALDAAKSEGNLSRANVVRKVKKQQGPTTRDQRADLITKLANQGYSSRQMPAKVGVTEESVRQIARDYDIDIPADRSIGRTRRINSTQLVVNTATALEGLVSGIELIDYDALDLDEASQWAASLIETTTKLASFARQIRKATQ